MSKVLIELEKPKSCNECQFSVTEWTTGTTNYMLRECPFSKETEAIPISWIRNYVRALLKESESEWDYIMTQLGGCGVNYSMYYMIGVEKLLADWEKENELDKV